MSDPATPVELVAVSPEVKEDLAPVATSGPLVLSPAATDALVAAAVASSPPKTPATPAQEAEEQLKTEGQRRVSAKWENVQAIVAIMMTTTTSAVATWLVVFGKSPDLALAALVFLTTSCSNVISTYFTRSNHTRVGGVGDKSERER